MDGGVRRKMCNFYCNFQCNQSYYIFYSSTLLFFYSSRGVGVIGVVKGEEDEALV